LTAPLPAGGYHLIVRGFNSANDAQVTAQLVLRSPGSPDGGGGETMLAQADGPPPKSTNLERTWIDTTLCAGEIGQPGDALLVRVQYVSGSHFFSSILTSLTLP
jgi:hypothetical protein